MLAFVHCFRFFSFLIIVLTASTAFAATPAVTSFTASPSSINTGYTIALSWSIDNGTGHDILLDCVIGVTFKKNDGSSFPCGQRTSVSSNASDNVGLTVINVSGTRKTVNATLFPKDTNGTDYDAGAVHSSFMIETAYQPILEFSPSLYVVKSGKAQTFTWKTTYLDGVNMQYDCVQGVSAYLSDPTTGSPTALPCGTMMFSPDLTASSQTLYFKASNVASASVAVHLFPAPAPGSYDGTHAATVTFSVEAPKADAVSPTATTDLHVPPQVIASVPFTISWTTANASHTNLEFDCPSEVTLFDVSNATSSLPCNTTAFSSALDANGTTTVLLRSTSFLPQMVSVFALPQNADGSYSRIYSKSQTITVQPLGSILTPLQPAAQKLQTIASTTTPPIHSYAHMMFIKYLTRGSKGTQVTELQKFLATNPEIYPEGVLSGSYGPATERAVQRFQLKFGLALKGDIGFGSVGPKTRAKLNTIQSL